MSAIKFVKANIVALSFTVALSSIGCSTATLDSGQAVNTAMVTVAGASEKLLRFDTKLRLLLGVGNDDSDTLGCLDCMELRGGGTPPPASTLTYLVRRKPENIFREFGAAWNEVWYDPANPYDAGSGRLVIKIDFNDGPNPDCSTGFVSPCYNRPNCPITGFCSKNQTGACLPKCTRAP